MQNIAYIFLKYSPMVSLSNEEIVWLKDYGIIDQLFVKNVPFRGMDNQVTMII